MNNTQTLPYDHDTIARQVYDWLKMRRNKREIDTYEAIQKATGFSLADQGNNTLTEKDCIEIHYKLMALIKKENEYLADFSAHDNEYLGLPCFIPFVFRKK